MLHVDKITVDNRLHLIPKDGYYITDGDKIYSKYLILAKGLTSYGFYAITDAEYQQIEAERKAKEQMLFAPHEE